MGGYPFSPRGNAVAVNASTTSAGIAIPVVTCALLVTNRSTTASAWVSWGAALPTAVFPTPGDTVGVQGLEITPGSQVTISVNGTAGFVAAVLQSGTGVVSFVPGDGL